MYEPCYKVFYHILFLYSIIVVYLCQLTYSHSDTRTVAVGTFDLNTVLAGKDICV